MKRFTNKDIIEFIGNSNLSLTDLRLLTILCNNAINNTFISNQTHIAEMYDLKQSNISKSLSRLENSGLIKRKDRVITIKFNIK